MKFKISLFYLILFTVSANGQGTRIDDSFYSASLNATRMVDVYLPEGYNPQDTTTRYPVIYFLHGWAGSQNSVSELIEWLDEIIGHTIDPVIVVKPDGGGSYWTNSNRLYEDYVVYDLVAYIDSVYNTDVSRDKRCIYGFSMGAHGSMKLALKHPDIFKGVVAHSSGALHFVGDIDTVITMVLAENGGSGPFSPHAGEWSNSVFFWAGYFSPNVNNPPYLKDLPFDNDGNIIDSTWTKWLLNDPAFLATQLSPETNLAIYFSAGISEGGGWTFSNNQAFSDTLESLGIPYTFHVHNHSHGAFRDVWVPALEYLNSVMNDPTFEILNEQANTPVAFILHQNYPNPFNPATTIAFTIREAGAVDLRIFNILGQEILTVYQRDRFEPGYYAIRLNTSSLPSGIYFYSLSVNDFVETRKMMVLK